MAKVLVVEDDASISSKVKDALESQHYTVEVVMDGREALEFLEAYKYDAIILDWELPGISGFEICQKLRKSGCLTPILMLTGKAAVEHKEAGLDAGADDYLTKPFDFKELAARLRSIIRRSSGGADNVLKVGGIVLEPGAHRVTVDGKQLQLMPKEFALLEFFMRNPSKTFSAETLLNCVWSSESDASLNSVRTYMYSLRKKLSACGYASAIETVHGVGYKLVVA